MKEITKLRREPGGSAIDHYRSFFENAVEGIYQTTVDGRYIRVNGGPQAAAFVDQAPLRWPAEMIKRHAHHHHRFEAAPVGPGAEVEAFIAAHVCTCWNAWSLILNSPTSNQGQETLQQPVRVSFASTCTPVS